MISISCIDKPASPESRSIATTCPTTEDTATLSSTTNEYVSFENIGELSLTSEINNFVDGFEPCKKLLPTCMLCCRSNTIHECIFRNALPMLRLAPFETLRHKLLSIMPGDLEHMVKSTIYIPKVTGYEHAYAFDHT